MRGIHKQKNPQCRDTEGGMIEERKEESFKKNLTSVGLKHSTSKSCKTIRDSLNILYTVSCLCAVVDEVHLSKSTDI